LLIVAAAPAEFRRVYRVTFRPSAVVPKGLEVMEGASAAHINGAEASRKAARGMEVLMRGSFL